MGLISDLLKFHNQTKELNKALLMGKDPFTGKFYYEDSAFLEKRMKRMQQRIEEEECEYGNDVK